MRSIAELTGAASRKLLAGMKRAEQKPASAGT